LEVDAIKNIEVTIKVSSPCVPRSMPGMSVCRERSKPKLQEEIVKAMNTNLNFLRVADSFKRFWFPIFPGVSKVVTPCRLGI